LGFAILAVSVSAGLPAGAQEESSTATSGKRLLEEVLVTAQRREQRLLDVPVAVSAIAAKDIENRNITSLDEMQAAVPALRMVDIGPGSQRIQLRGISQYTGLPTVGNYIDEFSIVNFGAAGVPEVQLLDMQRVEVLRGPQPVLYGESSMGGTIRYITADPDIEGGLSGSLFGEASNVDGGEWGHRVEGVVNVPVSSTMALRLSAAQREVGGWIDGPAGEDINGREINTLRGKLLFAPTDRLEVTVMGLYNESEQEGISYSIDGRVTDQQFLQPSEQEYTMGTVEIAYEFDSFRFLSVTGMIDMDNIASRETSAFYNTLLGAPLFTKVTDDSAGNTQRWSQEFRLTSTSDGPFRWLGGISYTDGETEGRASTTTEPFLFPGFDLISDQEFSSEIWAAFADFEYDVNDWLTLQAGGRYFEDDRSVFTVNDLPGIGVSSQGGEGTFDTFNPRFGITLKTGDSGIVYASAAKGFRSGGFNTAPGAPDPEFAEEVLWTYELGTKQSLFDGLLFVEFAVYQQQYEDIQSTNVTATGQTAVFNAGEASGPGADLVLQLAPTDDLSFSFAGGWNDVTFDKVGLDKLEGDPLDLVPELNWSLAADWTPTLGNGMQLIAHVDVNYTDQAAIILRQIGALGFETVSPNEERTLVNARVGLLRKGLEGYVAVSNIGDTRREVNPDFGAFVEPIFTQPRTIAVGLRKQF